jgi:Putative prokaryotic signal transducing protein
MKRLMQAPNVALATLWADMLQSQGGIATRVLRAYASGIAGEIPPDQALPEVWVLDDDQLEPARTLLHRLRHLPQLRWLCPGCGELVEGPFEECWNCGTAMPGSGAGR